jgi:hypothetical protein
VLWIPPPRTATRRKFLTTAVLLQLDCEFADKIASVLRAFEQRLLEQTLFLIAHDLGSYLPNDCFASAPANRPATGAAAIWSKLRYPIEIEVRLFAGVLVVEGRE